MYWLIRVFNRVFVSRFYEAHLLVFLFVLLAMFGMADGSTVLRLHYYILLTSFSSPYTLLYLWLAWLLYALNTLRYLLNTLRQPGFQFLHISNSAGPFKLLIALTSSVLQINAPVLIYGIAGVIIAISHHFYLNALLGTLGLTIIILVVVAIVYYRLVYIHISYAISEWRLLPAIGTSPNMLSILLRYVTTDSKMAFVGTKLFSCAVIYAAHYEWGSFNYDIRWMQVAMALSIPAQGILLYQVWVFETTYLSFMRNFPITMFKRYLYIFGLVLILLIPEVLLLGSYCIRFHILWQLPVYMLYAYALPMLLYAMLFTKGFNQESYNSFLFAMALATFFISLFGFTLLLALAFVPIGFLVYKEAFYGFERDVT